MERVTIFLKVPVIESEKGYGQKVEDYMVCTNLAIAKEFIKEFNANNPIGQVPDWYMQAEDAITSIELNDEDQIERLYLTGRAWLSHLRNLKKVQLKPTERGFSLGEFKDQYGVKCSIQKSSAAMKDCIWLGIDNPELTIFEDEKMGKYLKTKLPKNWMVDSRMHLTREQVSNLLPMLHKFVETGELH